MPEKSAIKDHLWYVDLTTNPPFKGAKWELFKPPDGIPASMKPSSMAVTDDGAAEFEYGPYKWPNAPKPYTYKVRFTGEDEGVQINMTTGMERALWRNMEAERERLAAQYEQIQSSKPSTGLKPATGFGGG